MSCNIKKILLVGLFPFISIGSTHAKSLANNLEKAFNTLTSTTRPGVYEAQIRGYMTGGGAQIHFPSYAVDLVSLSPPHYAAGCNGIDVYMGGLSYISGDQFVNLLKSIAANTMGYSFGLAMRTLCPVCATTVSQLQKVAQAANKLAINQCHFAMGLVNSVTGQQAQMRTTQQAALEQVKSGKARDFLDALNTLGNNIADALKAVANRLNRLQDKGQQLQLLQTMELGSDTWKALSGLDASQKLFIQSLLGTTVRYPYPRKHPKTWVVSPIAASMQVAQLVDIFMYGVSAKHPNNAAVLVNDCEKASIEKATRFAKLLAKHDDVLCMRVIKKPIKESNWYKMQETDTRGISLIEKGFFGLTYAILFQALSDVKNGKPLGSAANITLPARIYGAENGPIKVTFSKDEIEAFISIAPVPLYRAINIAAVYPTISAALIENISEIVAAHYAVAYLEQRLLNTRMQGNERAGLIGFSPKKIHALERALNAIHQRLHKRVMRLLSNSQAAERWTQRMDRIQEKIYEN